MSPVHQFDPTQVVAGFAVFPKDEYEFEVKDAKAFQRTNKKGEETYGIRFQLIGRSSVADGKKSMYTCYMHSDGAQSFSKQFLMAVYGFNRNDSDEKRFNAEYGDAALWSYDPESGAVGEIYKGTVGKRFYGNVEPGKNPETGEPTQQWKSFRPFSAAA
jgi:hypothetical protein